ncbi:MAG TPA: hypothetical protein VG537_01065 [Candidatus Kapabacteria bacterium]|nr:hypothetical protein [Candidatus Kapabacteria bacterium]
MDHTILSEPMSLPMGGKRESLFVVAYKSFPRSFLVKGIGLTFTVSLYIYRYLTNNGVDSILERVLLTALIVAGVPTLSLYLVTLVRAPRIRRREEKEAARLQYIAHGNWEALKAKEHEEEQEIKRLEQVASGDKKARRVKDEKDDKRWDVLTESLRLQNETVELASEERLLVAQQVKEIKEEGEVIRKGLAFDDLEARKVKDLKEDERWNILNEKLRVQKVAGQQTEDLKEEREEARKQLASVDLKAQKVKDLKETERWDNLNERLRARDETADGRSSAILHTKELKEEEDAQQREDVAAEVAKLLRARDVKDDERWMALDNRLQRQDERSKQRDEDLRARDEEFRRMWQEVLQRSL